jgi:hypothetical protein
MHLGQRPDTKDWLVLHVPTVWLDKRMRIT